jgi:hypothetical protein
MTNEPNTLLQKQLLDRRLLAEFFAAFLVHAAHGGTPIGSANTLRPEQGAPRITAFTVYEPMSPKITMGPAFAAAMI